MVGNGKSPVLVVVQLSGGNDFMNTLIPYTNPIYYDTRKTLNVPEDQVVHLNDTLGFHPSFAPAKDLYDAGKMAIVQGIGYPDSSRSHFRAMDIWHTCEPDAVGLKGWLGQATQELDPKHENVLTTVSFGRGMPRALACPDVPITSVGDLETYGLLAGITDVGQRNEALGIFQDIYSPAIGTGPVSDYLARTGLDVIKGAEILKEAVAGYTSDVEYAPNRIAQSLRDVARVHFADLGTRIFYTQHAGYDTHAGQGPVHPRLLSELASALTDFFQDIESHDASEEVVMLVFTEFGRRMKDNGSGTDHGTGGGAFIIGERVNGGFYSEYPSLQPETWARGEDLEHTIDFRGVYGTILEQWLSIDPAPIVGGSFEQIRPFN